MTTLTRADWEQRARDLKIEGRAYINGEYTDAVSAETFECISPVDGRLLGKIADVLRLSPVERAQLLQLLYSRRSERMLMEQLGYNLLFRWFVGLAIDDPVWDHSVFSKNRDRLNAQAVATEFLSEVVRLAEKHGLMSGEHFSVDGTLLQHGLSRYLAPW